MILWEWVHLYLNVFNLILLLLTRRLYVLERIFKLCIVIVFPKEIAFFIFSLAEFVLRLDIASRRLKGFTSSLVLRHRVDHLNEFFRGSPKLEIGGGFLYKFAGEILPARWNWALDSLAIEDLALLAYLKRRRLHEVGEAILAEAMERLAISTLNDLLTDIACAQKAEFV